MLNIFVFFLILVSAISVSTFLYFKIQPLLNRLFTKASGEETESEKIQKLEEENISLKEDNRKKDELIKEIEKTSELFGYEQVTYNIEVFRDSSNKTKI